MRLHLQPGWFRRFLPKYVYGALCSAYLFTFGVLRANHRYLVWLICRHFGWKDALPPAIVPAVTADRVVPEQTEVMVLEPHAVAGNVSLLELLFINRLVKHFRCERIFEIGTFDGRTAMNMAANASQLSTVFTLNLSEDDLGSTALAMMPAEAEYVRKGRSGARFKGSRYAERITQLLGDSATFDYSPYLGTMDLVFVDGSHAYDYVLNDSAVALKLVRKDRGIVLWHDYDNWPQAREALNHLYASDSAFRNMRYITGTSFVIQTQEAISGGLT